MSDFNKDEYLNDLPDMDNLSGQAALQPVHRRSRGIMAILQQLHLPIPQLLKLRQRPRTQHLPNRKKTAMLRIVQRKMVKIR